MVSQKCYSFIMSDEKKGEDVSKLTEAEKNEIVEKAISEGKKQGKAKPHTFWPDFWSFLTMIAGVGLLYREVTYLIKAIEAEPFGGLYNLGAFIDGAIVLAMGVVIMLLHKRTSLPKFFRVIGIFYCANLALSWIVRLCLPLFKGIIESTDRFFTVRMH